MEKNPISDDLFFWLQIVVGLETNEILELALSGAVKELEIASTTIASVLERRCPASANLKRAN